MSVLNFPNKQEREQGPSRLERTTETLRDQICAIRTNGKWGISGFSAETKNLSDSVAEISVTGLTETGNQVGLGRAELESVCEQLNSYLSIDARPFTVSVVKTRSPIPSTPDDDFTQNAHYTLQVSAQS